MRALVHPSWVRLPPACWPGPRSGGSEAQGLAEAQGRLLCVSAVGGRSVGPCVLVPVCVLRSRVVCVVSSRTWGSCPPFRTWSSHRSFRSKRGSSFLLCFQDSSSQPGPGHKVLTESGVTAPHSPETSVPQPPQGLHLAHCPVEGGGAGLCTSLSSQLPPPLSRSQGFYGEIRRYFYYVCKFPVLYWGRKLFDTNHSGNFIKCTCFEMEGQVTGDPNPLPPGHGVAVAPAAFRKGVSPCVVGSLPPEPGSS